MTSAAAASNRALSVEFIVKPREDLFLEGSLRKLPRVAKGEPYPCQMQKNQSFSCLFRHYAKHNGLRKEDLVFYFVDELLPDQTPESVHLMVQDEIWVEHRKVETEEKPACEHNLNSFTDSFRALLANPQYYDLTFIVGEFQEEVHAHRSIVAARSDYFNAMLKNGMLESVQNQIMVPHHDSLTYRRMLEYMYTDSVANLSKCPAQDILNLLLLSHEYCMNSLQELCETEASEVLSTENIARFSTFAITYDAKRLKQSCRSFLVTHGTELRTDEKFRKDVEESSQLGLFLFDIWPTGNESPHLNTSFKKRRISTESDHDIPPNSMTQNESNSEPQQRGGAGDIGW